MPSIEHHDTVIIDYGVRITTVEKDEKTGNFELQSDSGDRRQCRRLVIATGLCKPYIPDIDLTIEIHPLLRRFKGSTLQIEYHVKSDVLTDWDSECYRKPLIEFLDWDLHHGPRPEWSKPKTREFIRDGEMRSVDVRADGVSLSRAREPEHPPGETWAGSAS